LRKILSRPEVSILKYLVCILISWLYLVLSGLYSSMKVSDPQSDGPSAFLAEAEEISGNTERAHDASQTSSWRTYPNGVL
jgi:uncharacterized MAPEG superfamily protein